MSRKLISDERVDDIILSIECGAFLETAASSAGLCSRTVRGWRQKGVAALYEAEGNLRKVPAKNRAYAKFAQRIAKAEADVEHDTVRVISNHARGDWRAAAWLLERRNQRRWGASLGRFTTERVDELLDIAQGTLDDDAFKRLIAALVTSGSSAGGQ